MEKKMTHQLCSASNKAILIALITMLSFNVNGQVRNFRNYEPPHLWANEFFACFDASSEIIERRDATSKHFRKPDGSISAVIAAGWVHYWEDNQWKTIYHTITPSLNGFENTTNSFKTYYPQNANGRIVTKFPSRGFEITDMVNMRMYVELKNGNIIQSQNIQNSMGTTYKNELHYQNVYGVGIHLKLTQNTTQRKMDYIISDRNALQHIPQNAQYLVFEEKVELPSGWKSKIVDNQIQISDANGVLQLEYEKPIYRDQPHLCNNHHLETKTEIEGYYFIKQNGNILTIQTKVPTSWLLHQERVYPITIDPTLNCYPNNANNAANADNLWTGYIRTNGTSPTVYTTTTGTTQTTNAIRVGRGYYSGTSDEVYHSWAKFNTSNIPYEGTYGNTVCINQVQVRINPSNRSITDPTECYADVSFMHLANDPSSGAMTAATRLSDIRDGASYLNHRFVESNCGLNTWHTLTLNATASSDLLARRISGQNWFGFGMYTTGIYTPGHYDLLDINTSSSGDKIHIIVDYTHYYVAEWLGYNAGCPNWLPGETRTVSVTVRNAGCQPWTSGSSAPPSVNNVNFSWWGNWQSGQDANPRIFPYSGLAPGATQTIYFTVTAPTTPGAYTISVDNVREFYCWFRDNNSPMCGAGNISYSFPINVTPSALSSTLQLCPGSTYDVSSTLLPTGGTITTVGTDRVHTFTSSGTFNVPQTISSSRVLVVAGGGGGGFRHAGGGGAGGYIHNTAFTIPAGSYPVTVGAGGLGATATTLATNGGNSVFHTLTAIGGGYGSTNGGPASIGGSGGGGSNNIMGKPGTAGQGNAGGNQGCNTGSSDVSGCSVVQPGCSGIQCYGFGCGGGGAGAAGGNATGGNGSNGGVGLSNNITGSAVFYAGGGGGGSSNTTTYSGGNGGGGNGGNSSSLNGSNGAANTGGGGGGGGANGGASGNGGNGGSGIVVIRYAAPTYSSDNPAVATVNSSGLITGISNGTANITVNFAGSCQTIAVTVGTVSTPPTSITGGGTYCNGETVTLTSTGGTNGTGNQNVWYVGGCNNAFTQTWASQPYSIINTTVNSISNDGIITLTSTSGDPMIDMPSLGSFNPNIYRYINVRYRVTAGTAGAMEIFFHNSHWTFAHADHYTSTTLVSDGQWHIATLDLWQNGHYVGDGSNITGWRYDWATNAGVTMELDFIQLSQFPMIDENTTDNIFTLSPASPYYPTIGSSVTLASAKIDKCGATTCQSATVTISNPPSAPTATGAQRCDAGSLILSVNPVPGADYYEWYDNSETTLLQQSSSTTFTTPVIATTTVYKVRVKVAGCSTLSPFVSVVATIGGITPGTRTWNGNVSTDWFEALNWTPSCPPTCADDVIIPTGRPNYPLIGSGLIGACNNITIDPTGTAATSLSFGLNGRLNVCGHFTLNASATISTTNLYEIHFVGTNPQIISNYNNSFDYKTFVINNTSTTYPQIEINDAGQNVPLATDASLVFVSGMIKTNTKTLNVKNPNPNAITGYNQNRYVHGILRRGISGNQSYDYPVGDAHESIGGKGYQLLNINFTNNIDLTGLRCFFTPIQATSPAPGPECSSTNTYTEFLDNGFWSLIPTGSLGSTATYNLTLYNRNYTNGGSAGIVTNEKRADGSSPWTLNGTCNPTSTLSQSIRDNMTNFSDYATTFTIIVLPVELLSLRAIPNKHSIDVHWKVQNEVDLLGYEIQRSLDGINFSKVGFANAAHQSQYQFEDKNVNTGVVYYYRLKSIDLNGNYQYSNTVQASLNTTTALSVYPNPNQGNMNVSIYSLEDLVTEIQMFNQLGQKVYSKEVQLQKGINRFEINTKLAKGIYLLEVKNSSNNFYQKVVIE